MTERRRSPRTGWRSPSSTACPAPTRTTSSGRSTARSSAPMPWVTPRSTAMRCGGSSRRAAPYSSGNPARSPTTRDHVPGSTARRGRDRLAVLGRVPPLAAEPRAAPDVVGRLDDITDDVLGRLEDPRRAGAWDRRGMVVGQVQSGKTANYTGLICKAADAGYKFIVVLAGLHNTLRSQTQRRLDEGFLGLDSRTAVGFARARTGASASAPAVARHPSALHDAPQATRRGDFERRVASQIARATRSRPGPARRQEERDDPAESDRVDHVDPTGAATPRPAG